MKNSATSDTTPDDFRKIFPTRPFYMAVNSAVTSHMHCCSALSREARLEATGTFPSKYIPETLVTRGEEARKIGVLAPLSADWITHFATSHNGLIRRTGLDAWSNGRMLVAT